MRTVAHISDLHFGMVNHALLEPLLHTIREAAPDLVAVSGDLTQRARTSEFLEARAFLDRIPFPQIVVPGNHDVPLYNVLTRFTRRLDRYRRYITQDLAPFYHDEEIAVAGINTARSLTIKDGRINREQIAGLKARFATAAPEATRIVVTHHPFDLPEGMAEGRVVGGAHEAMETLAECRVDVLLAGHFHIAHAGSSAMRFRIPGYSALIMAAGTSTSTRGRGQPNTLNILRIEPQRITVECLGWRSDQARFAPLSLRHFGPGGNGWSEKLG